MIALLIYTTYHEDCCGYDKDYGYLTPNYETIVETHILSSESIMNSIDPQTNTFLVPDAAIDYLASLVSENGKTFASLGRGFPDYDIDDDGEMFFRGTIDHQTTYWKDDEVWKVCKKLNSLSRKDIFYPQQYTYPKKWIDESDVFKGKRRGH